MKERPILFSAPMVRAILDGSKTQTRRVVKLPVEPDPDFTGGWKIIHKAVTLAIGAYARTLGRADPRDPVICPYGQPGDRLWVRETWGVVSNAWDYDGARIDWTPDRPAMPINEMPFGQGYYSGHVIYAADGSYEWAGDDDGGGEPRSTWHPSIHMPRAASRILLEIISVRVERLNDCSESDAHAEGIKRRVVRTGVVLAPVTVYGLGTDNDWCTSAKHAYEDLWESINGPGSWGVNPWVWVVEFKRADKESGNDD